MNQPQTTTNVQPIGNAGMTATSRANPKGVPVGADGKREFSESLCGCFDDCNLCLTTCCCPCITYSKVSSRLEHLNTHGTPHPTGGEAISGACLGFAGAAILGVSCILTTFQRGDVRNRYNISGDGCTDFLTAWCCGLCNLVQVSREIELEENTYGKQTY